MSVLIMGMEIERFIAMWEADRNQPGGMTKVWSCEGCINKAEVNDECGKIEYGKIPTRCAVTAGGKELKTKSIYKEIVCLDKRTI